MIRALQSRWIAAAIGVVTYSLTTFAVLQPKIRLQLAAKLAELDSKPLAVSGPSWVFRNPELDQMLTELKAEKAAIQARAQQLTEWENRLSAEHQEMLALTQSVYRIQTELDQSILRVKEEEMANLKKLAKVYAGMSPEGAASILKEMQGDQVVRILVYMKEDEAAPILETLAKARKTDAKRAALITNRLRLALSRPPPGKTRIP